MQGTIQEISVYDLLNLIELGHYSGHLWLTSTQQEYGRSWLFSLFEGRIIHAAPASVQTSRIQDYLHRIQLNFDNFPCQELSCNPSPILSTPEPDSGREENPLPTPGTWQPSASHPEYQVLYSLLEQKKLNIRQSKALLQRLVDETLLDVLPLWSGHFHLVLGSPSLKNIASLGITPRLQELQRELQAWKQLYPLIKSPEQCPVVSNPAVLSHLLAGEVYRNLTGWADGDLSIRRLARRLNRADLTVAQAIYPYLERDLIRLVG